MLHFFLKLSATDFKSLYVSGTRHGHRGGTNNRHRYAFEPSFHLPFKSIHFLGEMYHFGGGPDTEILTHSPDVTNISLPNRFGNVTPEITSTVLAHCKHISALHLLANDGWNTCTWRESEVLALINRYQLQEFSTDLTGVSSERNIRALVQSSANVLQDLVFTNVTYNVFLETFLGECPELRIVNVQRPDESHQFDGVSLETLATPPWVCLRLESLEVHVVGGSWGTLGKADQKVHLEGGLKQEHQEAQWILQLYWKLKSLKRLQSLKLVWCSTKDSIFHPRTEFPLSSYMEQLLLRSGMNHESMRRMSLHCER